MSRVRVSVRALVLREAARILEALVAALVVARVRTSQTSPSFHRT